MPVNSTVIYVCDNPVCNDGNPVQATSTGPLPPGWVRLVQQVQFGVSLGVAAPPARASGNFHQAACATAYFQDVFAPILAAKVAG